MHSRDGIIHALPPQRSSHYSSFIANYEKIRAAEGRGSEGAEYYLALPYKDLTGRNSNQWKIRAKSYRYLVRHLLPMLPPGSSVLDIGAGNCWLSYRLASLGLRPIAVDLLTNRQDGLGAAAHFSSRLPSPLCCFQAEAVHLPFQSEQLDAVIFNASFHYAEDGEATLREALRCLKPTGLVIVMDTPWYSRDTSGRKMVEERRAQFLHCFGTASDAIPSLEYLTDESLKNLEERLGIQWITQSPWYGMRWAMRPLLARLRRQREPSRFRLYVAKKNV